MGHIFVDLDFFYWHLLSAHHFRMKLEHVASLLGHNVIDLACVILAREGEVRGLDNVAENVLAILHVDRLLVLLLHEFGDALRF